MSAELVQLDAGAIVLAGGKSRRMGQNKCLLPYHGVTLIEHVINQLRPIFPDIIISTNTPECYDFLGCMMVADVIPDRGPLGGLGATLAQATHDWNFLVAADIPELPLPLIRDLYEERGDVDCVVPRTPSGQLQPLFSFYHRRLAPQVATRLNTKDISMNSFVSVCSHNYLPVPENILGNINTPNDYNEINHH